MKTLNPLQLRTSSNVELMRIFTDIGILKRKEENSDKHRSDSSLSWRACIDNNYHLHIEGLLHFII